MAYRRAVFLDKDGTIIENVPYNVDPDAQESWSRYLRQLKLTLADGRRGDAVALFMRFIGTPAEQVEGMRRAAFWPGLEAVAPTLAYDHAAILGEPWSVPTELAASGLETSMPT